MAAPRHGFQCFLNNLFKRYAHAKHKRGSEEARILATSTAISLASVATTKREPNPYATVVAFLSGRENAARLGS